jgi:hypothetical protein
MSDFQISTHVVRDEIELAIRELKISGQDFFEVNKYKWQGIIKQIVKSFVSVNRCGNADDFHWAWERFKEPVKCFVFEDDSAYAHLKEVLNNEYVWFIAEDDFNKMWLYEAKANLIPVVLSECSFFEYYIVSKKYNWLLCENHHRCLIAVGESIIDKCMAVWQI